MTDQKLMVRSKYEKYSSCLATCRRSNKLSKTHNSVKNTGPSRLKIKHKIKMNDISRST